MIQKDKGLKAAIQGNTGYKLPTNFTYRMMQQIENEVALRNRRQDRRVFFALYLTIALLITGGATAFVYLYGAEVKQLFSASFAHLCDKDIRIAYLPILSAVPFLCILNFWLKRKSMRQ